MPEILGTMELTTVEWMQAQYKVFYVRKIADRHTPACLSNTTENTVSMSFQ